MIPAKAPKGVKNAPMFEPIIVAYIAGNGLTIVGKDEYKILIGMLLTTLHIMNEEYPYVQRE